MGNDDDRTILQRLLAGNHERAFAQIDRSSRFSPGLAPAVPAPFRGFAQQQLVRQALLVEQPALAEALARDLVRVRPLPAENLTLLAQSALMAGNAQTGLPALEEAGRRGWREPFAQQTMAQAAILGGNPAAAAQRVAALLATGSLDSQAMTALLRQLAATQEGRAALAEQLAGQGYWQRNFVRSWGAGLEPAQLAEIIAMARALGREFDCEILERSARVLRNAGNQARADTIDMAGCA